MLVAISIPIFTSQLEKSREATDLANIRSAYGEIAAYAVGDGSADKTATVTLTQKQANWEASNASNNVAGITISDLPSSGTVSVVYTKDTGKITIAGKEVKSSIAD